ncbi:hypothetical protein EUTSA_v10005722mg [Eutrema salsugineum]|uniref:Uncharacterized protein n=1 Tax=Eutrema salsugineum TaxID=72664 RepID=V4K0F2_EUTSA|nr:hypothetical protein EUTSA_v10005722mg [Eutrema salsugineum]
MSFLSQNDGVNNSGESCTGGESFVGESGVRWRSSGVGRSRRKVSGTNSGTFRSRWRSGGDIRIRRRSGRWRSHGGGRGGGRWWSG